MGHIVNPIGKRLGFVRYWDTEYSSQTNRIEKTQIYPYYTGIKKINKQFFRKDYYKETGLLHYGERIIFEKKNIKNKVFIQDFKVEKLEWEVLQEIQNCNKAFGKVKGEYRRIKKLGRQTYGRKYVSIREQNRRKREKMLKWKRVEEYFNLLCTTETRTLVFFYWYIIKAFLEKAFEIMGYEKLKVHFLIWQEPQKLEFMDREEAFQRYIEAGGKRIGRFIYNKPPIEQTFITPKFVAEYITRKLEQKHKLKDVLRPLVKHLGRHKALIGFKITCSGRFSRADRATYKWQKVGKVSLNTFKEFIDYDYSEVTLRFGQVGIKVWFSYNKKNLTKIWKRATRVVT
jgi:hypothetical protein